MLSSKFIGIGIAAVALILVIISIPDFQVSEINNNEILSDENETSKEIDFPVSYTHLRAHET